MHKKTYTDREIQPERYRQRDTDREIQTERYSQFLNSLPFSSVHVRNICIDICIDRDVGIDRDIKMGI